METEGQWCDNAFCPDRGKIDADNIKMHSYAERRFRCTICQRTFSADKGTFFATLRTPRPILLGGCPRKSRVCPTFYTRDSPVICGPFSINSAISRERYLIA